MELSGTGGNAATADTTKEHETEQFDQRETSDLGLHRLVYWPGGVHVQARYLSSNDESCGGHPGVQAPIPRVAKSHRIASTMIMETPTPKPEHLTERPKNRFCSHCGERIRGEPVLFDGRFYCGLCAEDL